MTNSNTEIWKDVPDYEGFYQVSNLGRVKRIDSNRILAERQGKNGYIRLNLSKNGEQKQAFVHQLVLKKFGSPQPNGKQVNHKNGNKKDNRIENLEWVTIAENIKHRDDVLGKHTKGTRNGSAILTESDVKEIKSLRAKGWTCKKISLRYAVGRAAISHIVNGRTWKHID